MAHNHMARPILPISYLLHENVDVAAGSLQHRLTNRVDFGHDRVNE
jgi:hypothetical protein